MRGERGLQHQRPPATLRDPCGHPQALDELLRPPQEYQTRVLYEGWILLLRLQCDESNLLVWLLRVLVITLTPGGEAVAAILKPTNER